MTTVDAELKRRDAADALVAWKLVADALSGTGLSDPVIDVGARASLVSLLAKLEQVRVSVAATGFVKSTVNTSTVALAAGAQFVGQWEDVTAYPEMIISMYGRPSAFQGDGTNSAVTLIFEFSNDGGATVDTYVPTNVVDIGYFIPFPLIPVGTHLRVSVKNDGGVAAGGSATPVTLTVFRLNTLLLYQPTKEITRTLSQTIRGDQPAILTRSVLMGARPDATIANSAVGGQAPLTPALTNLGAGGVYTSTGIDTESYPTIRLLIATDQVSASNGIELQWSDTANFATIRAVEPRTFRTGYVANGRLISSVTRSRFMRIVYTNGVTPQTRFFMHLRLDPVPLSTELSLQSTSAGTTYQQDVTVTAAILNGGTVPAGRKTLRLKNMTGSARSLFFGFTSAVTVLTGDELAPGEPVDLDIDETVSVYVITTSVSGAGVRCSATEIA